MSKLERALALLRERVASSPEEIVARTIKEDLRKLTNEQLERIISEAQPPMAVPGMAPHDSGPGGVPPMEADADFRIGDLRAKGIEVSFPKPDPEEVRRIEKATKEGFDRAFLGSFPPAGSKPGLRIIDDPVDAVAGGITGSFDPAAYGRYGPEWWIASPDPGTIPRLSVGNDLDLDCEDFGFSDFEAFVAAFGLHTEHFPIGIKSARNVICPITNQKIELDRLIREKSHSSLVLPAKMEVTLPSSYSEKDIRSMDLSGTYEADPTKT